MRAVVTGAAGFIGSHVVRTLVQRGDEAIAIVRPGSPQRRPQEVPGHFDVEELDIADWHGLSELLRAVRPDAVIHLAWYAEPGRYLTATAENLASLQATVGVLRAAHAAGCRRVVLAGTCLEDALTPDAPIYITAKRAAHAVGAAIDDDGPKVVCGHVFHLYGPGEDERRVVPSVIRALLRQESIATTDGTRQRDYLHVADVARGFCHLAASDVTGGVDICSGVSVSLRDVFEMIQDAMGSTGRVRIGELGPMADDGAPSVGDPTALRDLGWLPDYELRNGLVDTIDWWRRHGSTA